MLLTLSVRDFVIVESITLDLHTGFSALTGETGAGKSILFDALACVLGERAEASLVRAGAARAEVTATFTLMPAVQEWLSENDFDAEDELLLRRVVDSAGKSRAYINGSAATLAQLKILGSFLVDIHGQHAHQALLKPAAQRELLDNHAGLSEAARGTRSVYKTWHDASKALQQATENQASLNAERERVEWNLNEIEKLAPQEGEWQEIEAQQKRLAHAAHLIEGAQSALAQLSDDEPNIVGQLASMVHKLQNLAQIDEHLKDVVAALEPAAIGAQEAAYSLQNYLSKVDLDPSQLAAVETRVDALFSAARRARVAPEELPNEWQRLQQQAKNLAAAQDVAGLEKAVAQSWVAYQEQAKKLSAARKTAAQKLSKEITAAMQGLALEGGKFEIALNPCEPAAHGTEEVEFLVAGHGGSVPRALNKVASGGELSRISLAIAVITSQAQATPTLVFDEVDAGIGGSVAEIVGKLLAQLGAAHQVLCVTHLPQVAARAQHHFVVSKEMVGGQTLSQIQALDAAQRVEEIARMLGGVELTATTRQHAKEMLAG